MTVREGVSIESRGYRYSLRANGGGEEPTAYKDFDKNTLFSTGPALEAVSFEVELALEVSLARG